MSAPIQDVIATYFDGEKAPASISGIALGVLVTTAVLLTFDIIAERRGRHYLDALQLP